jgi:hypothetical protein
VASVGGLEKQYQGVLPPPLLSERGIALKQVVAAFQGAFQEAGGRTIEVTNREYQLRGSVNTEDLDKLEYLVVGRDRTGQAVQLRDVGYLQVGYDLRRGIADLDGAGEVVGGIAIMEQGRNVLAVTNALQERLTALRPSLPAGIEIVTTYDRSSLIWDTLTNFFRAIGYELLVVIIVIAVALRNLRAAVAPVCVLLLGTPPPRCRPSIRPSTRSRAGWRSPSAMADATIVIVENCTAELARRGKVSAAEDGNDHPRHRDHDSAAPLLDADHRHLVSAVFLPRRPRRTAVQPARVQQDVRDGVLDAAHALPASRDHRLGVQAAHPAGRRADGEPLRPRVSSRARRHDSLPLCVRGAQRAAVRRLDSRDARLPEGLHAGDGGRLHLVHADDAARAAVEGGRLDPAADGQEVEGVPEVERVFGNWDGPTRP